MLMPIKCWFQSKRPTRRQGTIPILRQYDFGLFQTHTHQPPLELLNQQKNITDESQQDWPFLDPCTQPVLCWRNIKTTRRQKLRTYEAARSCPKPKKLNTTQLCMDFFINGRNCCQFFSTDFPTWGGNLGPKLHPGGGFFGPWPVVILKNSHQDLSNEGSNFILSSLEVGHWVAQT